MSLLAFVRSPPRIDVGDDRHVGAELRERCLEAFHAILHAGDFRLVDDRDRAGLPDRRADQLAGLGAALHVVAGDVRDDLALAARAGDVGGEDRNAGVVRLDDRAADRLRIVGRQHDRVDLFRDEVFDLALLLGVIAIGIDDDELVAVFCRLGACMPASMS